ncbi:MAG: chromosome segregation protein SMC [Bryobacteraceae bacterium]|nr:chromosome segregation protein SMC [Bryobacteraceae bacterium]
MLRLKRVEIQGFKSFCDKTEMRFAGHGIAAIVGPNGCGKSNLSDAISWVLGEQSAKSLRGARMEDVIFAGTRDRKPLSLASVTMTLMDPEAQEATDGESNGNGSKTKPREITITRRLFRSGESEYLIDGKQARLRDIQDIFMGTGLGPESYAIIEQGRIGQILSSKPQDRRAVIEEAAGITRFKTKRRLAEAKLEGAKQNLTRVFDILEEVSRQVNSLKRQAAKAKRYEELKAELTAQLRRALTGRFRILEREAAKTAIELNLATSNLQKLSAEVAAKEQEQAKLQEQVYRTEAELTEERRKLAELRVEAERTKGRLESQSRQVASLEQRLEQGAGETQELERRREQMTLELEAHGQRLQELELQTEEARRKLAAKNEEREVLQNRLRERERGTEATRQQVLRLLGEASALKNQLAQVDAYLASLDRETARVKREEETAQAELERVEKARAEISEKLTSRQMQLESLSERRKGIEEELSVRKTKAVETRRQVEQLRGEVSRLKARKDSLEEIISHRSYTTESVKRLFTAIEKGRAQDLRPVGVLADFVEAGDTPFEKATEEFLHDELEYVVVKDWAQAERGIDLLRSDLDGRATFLVEPAAEGDAAPAESSTPAEPAIGPETGVVSRLSDVLRLTNGLTNAPAQILPRLARCFLVEERETARKLAAQYPDLYFLLPDGVCYHGRAVSGGKKTGAGPLALKRELRELIQHLKSKTEALNRSTNLLEELEREIAALSEELEVLRGQQQSQEKEAVALDHEMRKLSEEAARNNQRLSVARLELQRLEREMERSRQKRTETSLLVDEKERARAEQEQSLEAVRKEVSELQAEAARISEEHSALRVDLAGFEERRRAEQNARTRLEQQLREVAARKQEIAAAMERMGAERARLLADNVELDQRSNVLSEQILQLDQNVNRMAAQEGSVRSALMSLDEALKQMRTAAQEAQEKRSQVELSLVRLQSELKFLDETARKDLNASLEELAAGEETVLDDEALAEAEKRCQEVRSRIEALGPVNPQALEEFQEAQQRYDFLNAQRQDLLDSIRDTEKAIQEIDAESRKRFSEAFAAINENFRQMFRTLFGGGLGEMRLTDSESGDSGIDIVASPPGKKLQNVLLLSGGEKALTAVALLMAIFKYQPSPFCILDEVDAPLDEPNIERLTRLLKEMSSQTQFIVITHAKRTMEAAQAMYGVTMQEPGVSKLVSVRFQPPPAQQSAPQMAAMA